MAEEVMLERKEIRVRWDDLDLKGRWMREEVQDCQDPLVYLVRRVTLDHRATGKLVKS